MESIQMSTCSRGKIKIQRYVCCSYMPACHSGPELICHVLFTCPLATQAWSEAQLPTPRSGFSTSSIFLNLHHLLACCDKSCIAIGIRRAFPWVLWLIWKARNTFIFERTRSSTESLVKQAQDEAEEWYIATVDNHKCLNQDVIPSSHTQKWEPPPAPFNKCNMRQTHVIFEISSQKAVEAMESPNRYQDKVGIDLTNPLPSKKICRLANHLIAG